MNELVKHSLIYGLGQVLVRISSLLMLPVYTHFLAPADYGAIAILDLTAALVSVVIGGGIVTAVNRRHYAVQESERAGVWWTGWLLVAGICLVAIGPLWLLRGLLAYAINGVPHETAALYFAILLPHIGLELVGQVAEQYFRVQKRSRLIVIAALVRLAINMGVNVALLVYFDWGVIGVLTGNLFAAACYAAWWSGLFATVLPRAKFDRACAKELMRFGWPLIVSGLAALVMHHADKFFLQWWHGLAAVGSYALGYKLVYDLTILILTSFTSIWTAQRYEIAELPDADRRFATIAANYATALVVALLALSLAAPLLLRLLAGAEYAAAATIVPIIALGYVFYGMRPHLETAIYLTDRTQDTIPIHACIVVLNLALNAALVPPFGIYGAAWATVITFIAFAGGYGWLSQRLRPIPWRWGTFSAQLATAVVVYIALATLGARIGLAAAPVWEGTR